MPHEYNLNNLINFISSGIMTSNDVEDSTKEDLMKNLLKEVHDLNKIKEPNDKFPYFYTYVYEGKGKEKKRKKLFDKSKKGLLDKLIKFYALGSDRDPSKMTYKELFFEWVDYKEKKYIKLSPGTFKKYKRDYKSLIAGSKIENVKLCELTKLKLEDLLIELIIDTKMNRSNFNNIYSYFNMSLKYAYLQDYIPKNIMDFVDKKLPLQHINDTYKDDSLRILTSDQISLVLQSIKEHERKYPNYMPDYAIELAFLTGMRVGELAALKWTNINDESLHICLSEHRLDYDDGRYEKIIGLPKNKKTRYFPMTPEIQKLLERIKSLNFYSPEGYIFINEDGHRYEASTISCACSRRGYEAGIEKVSIHRIRRTVSSILNEYLPSATVAYLLGHSPEVNLSYYVYDNKNLDEKLVAFHLVSEKFSKFSNIVPFEEDKKIAKAL